MILIMKDYDTTNLLFLNVIKDLISFILFYLPLFNLIFKKL